MVSTSLAPSCQAPRDGYQLSPMPRKPRPPRPLPDLSRPAPPPVGQAAAFKAALDKEIVKVLGAIPLLLPLFERLGLRAIVNRHLNPSGAEHDPGLVVLILCLNRLLAPRPLVHVETWLAQTALPEVFKRALRHLEFVRCEIQTKLTVSLAPWPPIAPNGPIR